VTVYRVIGESNAQSRFAAAAQRGLTPLVGREEELGLLQQRWTHAKQGAGQVVLLSGEPGIGKSRLVQALKEQLTEEEATRIEFHCSPYHQNSALYPIIDHLQRLLQFTREDTPAAKLEKLQHQLSRYRFPQAETFPLFAALLSLPHPEGHPPIVGSPQKQKEKTQAALVAWLLEAAEQQPVCAVWEDLHWADPSTLEVLTLLLDQAPTARLLVLLTSRPEFTSPWGSRSYLTQLTLNRLGQDQVEVMIAQVAVGTPLPAEVVEQIRAKTDGVPLFVEELTKSVMESVGAQHAAPGQFTIPATLQDSLMARLDRLGTAKEIAQLGATLGREFSYDLLHAVSPLNEATLQQELRQLIETELLYQRGLPPQATYLFKHALIQDTAYQSLLKSRRQQLHQQIAHVLEEQFAETKETQPELVAQHYTEAGLTEQAIPYWQQAGQQAVVRSAYIEAVNHLTKGVGLLQALPDTPARAQQELFLPITLGQAFSATKGFAASEVEHAYARALELSRRVGEFPQLFEILAGLHLFYHGRREFLTTGLELAEQMMRLAQNLQDPDLLLRSQWGLGFTVFWSGEFASARTFFEQALSLYEFEPPPSIAVQLYRAVCLLYASANLWHLGYPDQGLKKCQDALTLAKEFSDPQSLVIVLNNVAWCYLFRGESQLAQELAEKSLTLANEHGFAYWGVMGAMMRGEALAEQGQLEQGIAQMQQSMATWQAIGADLSRIRLLHWLAAAYGKTGQAEEGLKLLAEALEMVDKTDEHWNEAELYRLKGELTLQQESQKAKVKGQKSKVETKPQGEAEACFLKAIEIAQKQQAKSLELRATVSLARRWQQQGKQHAARDMLSEIYNWFTEGFDTKDLQEAKTLLDELGK
jgi:predicted ATPase/energy-coupling factor transporter ATP-binding protein EcfA2